VAWRANATACLGEEMPLSVDSQSPSSSGVGLVASEAVRESRVVKDVLCTIRRDVGRISGLLCSGSLVGSMAGKLCSRSTHPSTLTLSAGVCSNGESGIATNGVKHWFTT